MLGRRTPAVCSYVCLCVFVCVCVSSQLSHLQAAVFYCCFAAAGLSVALLVGEAFCRHCCCLCVYVVNNRRRRPTREDPRPFLSVRPPRRSLTRFSVCAAGCGVTKKVAGLGSRGFTIWSLLSLSALTSYKSPVDGGRCVDLAE